MKHVKKSCNQIVETAFMQFQHVPKISGLFSNSTKSKRLHMSDARTIRPDIYPFSCLPHQLWFRPSTYLEVPRGTSAETTTNHPHSHSFL